VAKEQLATANARVELARTVAYAGGPALGGLLVGSTGAGFAFALATALSILAALLLLNVPEPEKSASTSKRRPLHEAQEGLAFVAGHPMLRPIFITQFVFNTAFFIILAVFVPYAVRHLALSASGVGVTLGFFGAGMVAGALLAPTLMRRRPLGLIIGIGPIAGLVAALIMTLTIWVPAPALAALGFFLFGAGPILWVISTTTLRQSVTPSDLLGRVTAVNTLAYAARPLGAAIGSFVGWQLGAEFCLVVAAAGFFLQAAVIWMSPAVTLGREPRNAAAGAAAVASR
jgi:predicted MFS family arabinose efflux permease